jgi:tetratricopeptide (TPR) repeat protein
MRPTVKYLSSACAGALLIACADLGHRGEPVAPPAQTAGSPDDYYLMGRQQHLASRFPAAIEAYQAALRGEPRHVNANNGLATLYAERGELARAIALWRGLTAGPDALSGPGAAFLFSNLGYAYLLNGDYQQAVGALERACVLDPLNYRAWRHLGGALDKLGQHERAQLMYKQASTLEQHDIKADYALVGRSAAAPADKPVVRNGWGAAEVRQTSSGIFELRRAPPVVASPPTAAADSTAAAVADPTASAVADPTASAAAVVTMPVAAPDTGEQSGAAPEIAKLEIRNGNGVTGMARSLARKMSDPGMRVVRLSNEKGFNVEHTRVEYQGAFREAASRLAERFGGATMHEVEGDANAGADVRLVIGRDLVRSKAEARRIIKAALARAAKAG